MHCRTCVPGCTCFTCAPRKTVKSLANDHPSGAHVKRPYQCDSDGGRIRGVLPESLDIERRHMAALAWDAMFRRAAILADGGGGYLTWWLYGVQQKWVVLCRF